MDESPTSNNLYRARVKPIFKRRISAKNLISPWGLLRVKVMAEMPHSWPLNESTAPTLNLRCLSCSCHRQRLHTHHGTRSHGIGKTLDCSQRWRAPATFDACHHALGRAHECGHIALRQACLAIACCNQFRLEISLGAIAKYCIKLQLFWKPYEENHHPQ